MHKVIKKITDTIKTNKSFLVTSHMSLEGDALGSELALYLLLKNLQKKVVICNNDPTPFIYKFLPATNFIKNKLYDRYFDVGIVLDCSDISRTGKVKDYFNRVRLIINIDHHISNTYFGDINWVDTKASSTCQMLYTLFRKFRFMDKKIALCLYTGIFTDTGSFKYANTNSRSHRIVSDLLSYGITSHKVDEQLSSLCTPEDLHFIGKVLSMLKFDEHKKICWVKLKKWEEHDYDLTEIIFSILRLLKGVEVFVLFKKVDKNKIRVNFRSRSSVDVNKIAQFFGGGGHKCASGTTIEDTLENAENKVISFIRKYTNGFIKQR
ncbi:MAG: bifunctional oligoribonuclease/PAP phosphatase NrnA [Candidatus Omnitrophica bacterium]|nr:bifunctional oligoribonuclease/PAP phosphatase NrnA [Candidatus Omnitrophota bacterium]